MFVQHDRLAPAAIKLRKMAGQYLKELREKAGLTQMEVNNSLGYEPKTNLVSQIERGISRVPPTDYHLWARMYNVEVAELATKLLGFYDPFTYQAIFGRPWWITDRSIDADLVNSLAAARAGSEPH